MIKSVLDIFKKKGTIIFYDNSLFVGAKGFEPLTPWV